MLVEVHAVAEVQEPGAVDGEADLPSFAESACAIHMPRSYCVCDESIQEQEVYGGADS